MEELKQQWRGVLLYISTEDVFLKRHHSSQNAEADEKRVPALTYQVEDNNLENW